MGKINDNFKNKQNWSFQKKERTKWKIQMCPSLARTGHRERESFGIENFLQESETNVRVFKCKKKDFL